MSENNQQPKTQEQLLHDVETLLQRNEEILKRVKRYLFWAQILGSVKILLIVLPLIAAAYFLPTLMEQFTNMYKNAGIFNRRPPRRDVGARYQLRYTPLI